MIGSQQIAGRLVSGAQQVVRWLVFLTQRSLG